MKAKILIVEDEVLVAEELAATLEDYGYSITDQVISGEKALDSFRANRPDLVVMDIDLAGEWDGTEAVKQIQSIQTCPIIYLTAKSTHRNIQRAMSTNPAAFLTKPYNEIELTVAIEIAVSRFEEQVASPSQLFLKKGNRYEKVLLQDILFAKADGSYVKVHTEESDFTLSYNLSTLLEKLDNKSFCRVHRSYVVQIDKVTAIEKQALYIKDYHIPVAKAFQTEIFKHFPKG